MRQIIFLLLLLYGATAFAQESGSTHGLSVWGTLKYPSYFSHFDYVNPAAPKGGEVKLSATGSFDSLNPFIVKGNRAPGIASVFESLMVPSLDEPQSVYGLIAKKAYVSRDRKTVDFFMRPEARFQDGSKLTADDVVFSFNTLKKDGDPTYRITYAPIAKAEKINPYQVRFTFGDTSRRDLPLIAATMPIFSQAYYATHDFTQTSLEPPLASGPYHITKVDAGRSIVYERGKNYWGEKLPVNVGQNNFDIIRYDMYRDETVALEAFKAGAYDFREESIARAWATGYDSAALREGRIHKELIRNQVPQGMQGFVFNARRNIFSDRRVREAIAKTLDFEWMNKTLFYGAYERDTSYFINTPYAATGLPDKKETALLEPYRNQLPPDIFTKEFHLPKTDGSGNDRTQLKEANALLNDAGWIIKDGVRVNAKTGEKLHFEFLLHMPVFERVVSPMRRQLKRLGIDASIRVIDEAQYEKRLETFDFDIVTSWINRQVFFPGVEQMALWHSSQADEQGSNNLAGVKNPVIDALLARINSAKTEEELRPAARALDRVLLREHYMIPHWNLSAYRVAYRPIFGQPAKAPLYSLGFQTWWIK